MIDPACCDDNLTVAHTRDQACAVRVSTSALACAPPVNSAGMLRKALAHKILEGHV